jgi:ABC-2 type transport system permease protein
MREFLALVRAGWRTASSYRLGMAFSLASLLVMLVPLWFVARALQPVAERSIASEGGQYFGFLVVGAAAVTLVSACLLAPQAAVGGAIGAGTLESVLATPAPPAAAFLGLVGYDLSWAGVRALVVLAAGLALGMPLLAAGLLSALLAAALLAVCHLGLGFAAAALVVAFRTAGPIPSGLLTVSTLLGGAYYSTTVIPSWLGDAARAVPMTYGLRAMRRGLLLGASPAEVAGDLAATLAFAVAGAAIGVTAMRLALRHARRAGLLGRE